MSGSSSNSSHDALQCPPTFLPIFMAFFTCYLLLLPLFTFVLYVGHQRWRTRRSDVTTHSDVFTFNMVAMELIGVLGSFVYCCASYTDRTDLLTVGLHMYLLVIPGQNLFHVLTCVERYLAVVHPVTYRGLKQSGGVRIRNLIIGGVWLVSFGSLALVRFPSGQRICFITLLLISSVVIFFCSLAVLCVLIRPGPGEVGGSRPWLDQSKRRAFQTITAILGTLFLRFLSTVVNTTLNPSMSLCDFWVVVWSLAWFSFPSSLVLPLLFLHRAGKLKFWRHNTVSD